MSYATIADLEKRLKREYASIYADDDTGVVDEDLVTEDLTAAAAEIDGKIAVRYVTPVTGADALALLKSWNLFLAMELAYARSEAAVIPEKIKDLAKGVRKQLDSIEEGKQKLPGDATENTTGAGSDAEVEIDDAEFTREKMQGF